MGGTQAQTVRCVSPDKLGLQRRQLTIEAKVNKEQVEKIRDEAQSDQEGTIHRNTKKRNVKIRGTM